MIDEPFYQPDRKPAPKREPKPGELLFEFTRGTYRYRVELRAHGEWGTEAQFLCEGLLHFARTLPTRELAIAWAEQERKAMRGAGSHG